MSQVKLQQALGYRKGLIHWSKLVTGFSMLLLGGDNSPASPHVNQQQRRHWKPGVRLTIVATTGHCIIMLSGDTRIKGSMAAILSTKRSGLGGIWPESRLTPPLVARRRDHLGRQTHQARFIEMCDLDSTL